MTNTVWAGPNSCWFITLPCWLVFQTQLPIYNHNRWSSSRYKNGLKMLGDLDVFLLQHHADVQFVGRSEVDLQILDLGRS